MPKGCEGREIPRVHQGPEKMGFMQNKIWKVKYSQNTRALPGGLWYVLLLQWWHKALFSVQHAHVSLIPVHTVLYSLIKSRMFCSQELVCAWAHLLFSCGALRS